MMRASVAVLFAWTCFAHAQADTDALAWLRKVHNATHNLSYSGIFVFQQGERVETSRITRFTDGQNDLEKLEVLDGTPREILRDGDVVRCYLSETRTIKIDRRGGRRAFPALLPDSPARLTEHYAVTLGRTGRIAGFDCQEILLTARDEYRYSFRLWADARTGMLLKASILDARGDAIEQFAFTQLRLGGVTREKVINRRATGNWKVEEGAIVPVDLSKEGWEVAAEIVGYRKLAEIRRAFSGTRQVAQVVYSDGLGAVSVFIEPAGSLREPMQPGMAGRGATHFYAREFASHVVTAVGDAPSASVRRIADSLAYRGTR